MSDPVSDDRLEQLERRVAALERLVRELQARSRLQASPHPTGGPSRGDLPPAVSAPARTQIQVERAAPPLPRQPSFDLEQWFGGRGLLLVGIVALLAAAAFFLNYAFERGWIPPWLRVLGAVVGGIAVSLAGEQQVVRGLRRFGLGLVGAGGGLAYLGTWAAAGPFAMLPRQAGIGLVASVTALVAWRAVSHRTQALALWALLGALLAPIFLPAPETRPEALLAYLLLVSGTAGVLAVRFAWQATLDFAAVGYFGLALALVSDTLPTATGMLYLALGAGGTLAAWQRRPWAAARLGGFLLGWLLLLIAATRVDEGVARWAAFAGGALLLVAEWAHARAQGELRDTEPRLPATLDAVLFLLAPLAFIVYVAILDPTLPGRAGAAAALATASLYLGAGWPGRWAPFVGLGCWLVALAAVLQFDGAAVIVGWSGLIVIGTAADRWLRQRAGPAIALTLGLAAGVGLFTVTLADRAPDDPAFTGAWALALYGYVGAVALAAAWWTRRPTLPSWLRNGRTLLWTFAGLAALGGVSLEIGRFFDARAPAWAAARLAGDLCLSVYWLLFAGATVWLGFRRNDVSVRGAGLLVAGVAAAKIAVHDLSRLQALYRVGSFFVLALLALAVAYAYNRQAKRAGADDG